MKRKQTLFELLTTNFLVHIRNEENFSLKRSFRINYAKILVFLSLTFVIFALLTHYFIDFVNKYTSDTFDKEKAYNQKVVQLAMAVDSLQAEIALKDTFILQLKRTITGEVHEPESKRQYAGSGTPARVVPREDKLSEQEIALREEFENKKNTKSTNSTPTYSTILPSAKKISDILFFTPISGIVSKAYDPYSKHLGIDVISRENEPIKCIADGVVIYSGWSYETGYMLVIQHDNNLISVYKHNSSLLKKVGEFARTGEAIAIIGNSGELTTGPHLHFELWYKGNPLNPVEYIAF